MTYRAPVAEMRFLLEHVLGAGRLAETARFAEATPETVEAILGEAARLAEDVLAPLRRAGDLDAGAAGERRGAHDARASPRPTGALAEGGWVGIAGRPRARRHGAAGDARSPASARCSPAANLALSLCPLLTQGQIEALEHHAPGRAQGALPAEARRRRLDRDDEPDRAAGGLGRRRGAHAAPSRTATAPIAVTGQKIFISWGDHDMAENVCHLVLARLPDGAPGTRGISLFLVPKFLPDADGPAGRARTAVRAISLEHKMGLHGSPTCVMEYDARHRLADRRARTRAWRRCSP